MMTVYPLTMPTNFKKRVNEMYLSRKKHLRSKHPNLVNSNLKYFETLKKNRTKIISLFATQTATLNRALEASYEISLLTAKNEKNHTIRKQKPKNFQKPAIFVLVKTFCK